MNMKTRTIAVAVAGAFTICGVAALSDYAVPDPVVVPNAAASFAPVPLGAIPYSPPSPKDGVKKPKPPKKGQVAHGKATPPKKPKR